MSASPRCIGSVKRAFPNTIQAELATRVETPPFGDEWIHESKFDGYRIFACRNGRHLSLLTRENNDWTEKFSPIIASLLKLPANNFILDGEVCVVNAEGRTDFQLLQSYFQDRDSFPLRYFVFDILYLNGRDVRACPLLERKQLLSAILPRRNRILVRSGYVRGNGDKVFALAQKNGLEGIVSKHVSSLYLGARTKQWLKAKCVEQAEFVIAGFAKHSKLPNQIGALFLGYFEGQSLRYCGKVGTGFSTKMRSELFRTLNAIRLDRPPRDAPKVKAARWVKPVIVAQIEFTEWTEDNKLRHPSFKGLRDDKKPQDVHRERVLR